MLQEVTEACGRLGWCSSSLSLQDTLVEQLELCVDYLWKSERHELIADINKPVIAVFEKRRDFKVTAPHPAPSAVHLTPSKGYSTCVSVCACRGCRSSTTTSTAPTSRWPRWWTQRSGSLVATTEWLSMDRWGNRACACVRTHNRAVAVPHSRCCSLKLAAQSRGCSCSLSIGLTCCIRAKRLSCTSK